MPKKRLKEQYIQVMSKSMIQHMKEMVCMRSTPEEGDIFSEEQLEVIAGAVVSGMSVAIDIVMAHREDLLEEVSDDEDGGMNTLQ